MTEMKRVMVQKSRNDRGIALIMVLFLVVVLVLVAVVVLSIASNSANDTWSVQTKNQTFNAAEAGMEYAQWSLDQNLALSAGYTGSGSVNSSGYNYNWSVVGNQLTSGSAQSEQDANPRFGNITIPSGMAVLAGWASAPTGGRTVYVEEAVQMAAPTYFTPGAIICGKTGQIDHQQIYDTSGNNGADIHCGTILATGGGQVPQGKSYASGTINEIFGSDHQAHTNAPPPVFLTAAQLAAIRATTLAAAESGGSNYYTSGNVTGGTIGSSGSNCVAYIGGSIVLHGNGNLTNYCTTTVVMGDVTIGGNAAYQALPASAAHITYVFGTGGTTLQGTPTTVGFFYVANADVTINGGGKGSFTGSVITPNNVTMNGGGTSDFYYNSTQTAPPVVNPYVVPLSQWDY
jgi:hypothetical protein